MKKPAENKKLLADIISLLAMTDAPVENVMPESLKYRLLGSGEDIGTWGHEVSNEGTRILPLKPDLARRFDFAQMSRNVFWYVAHRANRPFPSSSRSTFATSLLRSVRSIIVARRKPVPTAWRWIIQI